MMKQRHIALFLAFALLLTCLAGCGGQTTVEVRETPAPAETAAPAEAPETTEAPAETAAPEETADPEAEARKARYQAGYEKFSPNTTVMLVNDEPVSWADYYSWLYDIASQIDTNYEITDWN